MRKETRFIARDGTEFRTELECLNHEVKVTLPNGLRESIRRALNNLRIEVRPNDLGNIVSTLLRSREDLMKFFENYNGTLALLELAKKVEDANTHAVEQ